MVGGSGHKCVFSYVSNWIFVHMKFIYIYMKFDLHIYENQPITKAEFRIYEIHFIMCVIRFSYVCNSIFICM